MPLLFSSIPTTRQACCTSTNASKENTVILCFLRRTWHGDATSDRECNNCTTSQWGCCRPSNRRRRRRVENRPLLNPPPFPFLSPFFPPFFLGPISLFRICYALLGFPLTLGSGSLSYYAVRPLAWERSKEINSTRDGYISPVPGQQTACHEIERLGNKARPSLRLCVSTKLLLQPN